MVDDALGDEVRVTVIATGFDRAEAGARVFDREGVRSRAPEARRGDIRMDDRQRSSLEIPDDEIDIPSFLRDR